MYAGDLYILRENQIIGMVGQLKFRKVPRLLMDRFFSPQAASKQAVPTTKATPIRVVSRSMEKPTTTTPIPAPEERHISSPPSSLSGGSTESYVDGAMTPEDQEPALVNLDQTPSVPKVGGMAGKCLEVIAHETGLELTDLSAQATFVELGVDSLMSLVLSEKFRSQLGLEIKSSLFLECPTVGSLSEWLEQYC